MLIDSFTAFDFETANYKRSSACAIGLVKVEKGIITEEKSFLIKPQPNYFISSFINIHNITPEMVKDAPFFGEIWDRRSLCVGGNNRRLSSTVTLSPGASEGERGERERRKGEGVKERGGEEIR